MFRIKDLLILFPNKETREILIYSYNLSQKTNKGLSDIVFEQFLILKKLKKWCELHIGDIIKKLELIFL